MQIRVMNERTAETVDVTAPSVADGLAAILTAEGHEQLSGADLAPLGHTPATPLAYETSAAHLLAYAI